MQKSTKARTKRGSFSDDDGVALSDDGASGMWPEAEKKQRHE
jgi:hypothetical protein